MDGRNLKAGRHHVQRLVDIHTSGRELTPLKGVIFADVGFPSGDSIPTKETLQKYDHLKMTAFPILRSRKIDLIIGAPEIKALGIMIDHKWTTGSTSEPMVGSHPLGDIYWGPKETSNEHRPTKDRRHEEQADNEQEDAVDKETGSV